MLKLKIALALFLVALMVLPALMVIRARMRRGPGRRPTTPTDRS